MLEANVCIKRSGKQYIFTVTINISIKGIQYNNVCTVLSKVLFKHVRTYWQCSAFTIYLFSKNWSPISSHGSFFRFFFINNSAAHFYHLLFWDPTPIFIISHKFYFYISFGRSMWENNLPEKRFSNQNQKFWFFFRRWNKRNEKDKLKVFSWLSHLSQRSIAFTHNIKQKQTRPAWAGFKTAEEGRAKICKFLWQKL